MSARPRSARGADPGRLVTTLRTEPDRERAIHGCRDHQPSGVASGTSRTSLTASSLPRASSSPLTASTRSQPSRSPTKPISAPGHCSSTPRARVSSCCSCKTRTTRTPSSEVSRMPKTWSRTRTRSWPSFGRSSSATGFTLTTAAATCERWPSVTPPSHGTARPSRSPRVPADGIAAVLRRHDAASGNGCREPGSDRVGDHVRQHGCERERPTQHRRSRFRHPRPGQRPSVPMSTRRRGPQIERH